MKKAVVFFTSLFLLVSCFSDDDYVVDAALNGTWALHNVSCFCGFEEDFDFGAHKLTFDSSEQRVVVQNAAETYFITESGSYTFANNGNVLTINGRKYTYEIRGNDLKLIYVDDPSIADDEITLFYTRS